jgi:hypothetical protein
MIAMTTSNSMSVNPRRAIGGVAVGPNVDGPTTNVRLISIVESDRQFNRISSDSSGELYRMVRAVIIWASSQQG